MGATASRIGRCTVATAGDRTDSLPSLPESSAPSLVMPAVPVTPAVDSEPLPTPDVAIAPDSTVRAPGEPRADDQRNSVQTESAEPPRRLTSTRWLRIGVISTVGATWAATFFGSLVAVIVAGLAGVFLLAWCANGRVTRFGQHPAERMVDVSAPTL